MDSWEKGDDHMACGMNMGVYEQGRLPWGTVQSGILHYCWIMFS